MNLENCTKILDRIIHIAKSQGTPEVHCGCRFPIILAMCGVEFKGEVKAPYYYYNTVDDTNFYISALLKPDQIKVGESIMEIED